MYGGSGDDSFVVDNSGDLLFDTAGDDWVVSEIATFELSAGFENFLAAENAGNIEGQGNQDDNSLVGNSGENILYSFGGNDVVVGNGGDDFIASVTGDDSLYGGSGSDVIFGNGGDDLLGGGNQADSLNGRSGNDSAYGGGANDSHFRRAWKATPRSVVTATTASSVKRRQIRSTAMSVPTTSSAVMVAIG